MDFPTIKKPKSNKQLSANLQGSKASLFAKLEAMEQATTASPEAAKSLSAKSPAANKVPSTKSSSLPGVSAKSSSNKQISADLTDYDSDVENAAEEAAEKAINATGGDTSDKAEALRTRALLMKAKASSLGKGAMSEEFNPKRKKK